MESIPVIDLGPLLGGKAEGRAAVAAALGRAAREIGFFYVSGHGVEAGLIADVFRRSAEFFALPEAAKAPLSIARSPHNRGYVAIEGESLDPSKPADLKEAFNIGLDLADDDPRILVGEAFRGVNLWPDAPRLARDDARLFRRGLGARAPPA